MEIRQEALEYVKNSQEELIQLIRQLCAIPSFSHHEQKKAKFIQRWFAKEGIEVTIDAMNNVILPVETEDKKELVVFAAHTDTVFPDETGFECREEEGWLMAPGVGDDTANLAELMLIARYVAQHGLHCEKGCLFVFNSCEEGLGNLDGIRYLFESYAGRIDEFYSFDGGYHGVVNKAVGSSRYEVTVKTEGGHSYGAFGNRNAIAYASGLIGALYQYKVPTRGKSTYNVGVIDGGTSVNTIAQNARFLFEYRSDDRQDLEEMKEFFMKQLDAWRAMGIEVELKVLGERPCMGPVSEARMEKIYTHVCDVIRQFTGTDPDQHSGSTDCNIPFSLGIAGCCFGGYLGQGAHTREEKIEIASLLTGMQIVTWFILDFFQPDKAAH